MKKKMDPDPLFTQTDPRTRIKMERIRNTADDTELYLMQLISQREAVLQLEEELVSGDLDIPVYLAEVTIDLFSTVIMSLVSEDL